MQSERQKLTNRRLNVTNRLEADSGKYYVSFGIEPQTGRIGEVFIRGSKIGSDMDILLDDATVVLSLALQYGVPLDQLIHSLHTGREEGGTSVLAQAIVLMENERREDEGTKKKVASRKSIGIPIVPSADSAPEEG